MFSDCFLAAGHEHRIWRDFEEMLACVCWQFDLPSDFQFELIIAAYGHNDIKLACRFVHPDGRASLCDAKIRGGPVDGKFFFETFDLAARKMSRAFNCPVTYLGAGWPETRL